MIYATASPFLTAEAEGVFRMEDSERKSMQMLVESADTVAKAAYKSDKGKQYEPGYKNCYILLSNFLESNLKSLIIFSMPRPPDQPACRTTIRRQY